MKKFWLIIILVCVVVPFAAFLVVWNILAWSYRHAGQDASSLQTQVKDSSKITEIYGVKIQQKCLEKFDDFIKNYGSDYSKCLVDFDFKEEYCGGFDPETQGLSNINVVVILDSSGSMKEEISSEEKIVVAKRAVTEFMSKMPSGVNTGLVVYGHRGSNSFVDKDLSCRATEEVVKLGANNNNSIISAMNSFDAKGWTPIAGSLKFAKDIFKSKGENNKNYLILLSDGAESCDGDPIVAAEDLKFEMSGINLIVIGFATDSETTKYLQKISAFGGGAFMTAGNSAQIADAFNKQLLTIKKDCLRGTLYKIDARYKENNLSNLNCWLTSYEKESNDFTANVLQKTTDGGECNTDISNALRARHTDFWNKKQDMQEKNDAIYKQIQADYQKQLKDLENQKN